MKFTAITLAAVFGLATAAPTPAPAIEERGYTTYGSLKPTYNSVYNRNTGGLTYNPAAGSSIFDKTTTISTFTVDASWKGSKCRLGFYLDGTDSLATLTSATGVQIFSTNSVPPKKNVASWGPPGNQRNQHLGNLKLVKPGEGVVDDWPRTLEKFDCPTGVVAYEVAAKWDVGVEWGTTKSGLYLEKVV